MPLHRLTDLTWTAVRDLDRSAAVAILPVGATEAHGPHLPLSTDVVIAEAMARSCAEKLSADGTDAVLLPPIWYTAAPFARAFPGTVDVAADTVTRLVGDVGASLAAQGFRTLAIANAHLDPAHLGSLRAVADAPPGALRIVFLDLTRRGVASRLGAEFRTGACHAGRFEGSVVRAERPDLYRAEVAARLPPNASSLSDAIRAGAGSFAAAGGPEAYFGWPADATADEGRRTVDVLGELLAEAVRAALAPDAATPEGGP